MKIRNNLCSLTFLASASMAMAFTPITNVVTLDSGLPGAEVFALQSLTAGGNTLGVSGLSFGTSSYGGATIPNPWGTTLPNMDDFDLNTRASGGANYPLDTIFAHYTPNNGSLPDFFLFEAGANPDDVSITPIFSDNTFGTPVSLPTDINATGWGLTGKSMTQQQAGQAITGIAWDITEMKDAGGNFLAPNAAIKGIRIGLVSGGIDPTTFLAIPEPSTMALAFLGMGGLALLRKRK
jgi:hypothetical protein